MSFQEFFHVATGYYPYAYQEDLAVESLSDRVLRVPTGGGKTEAAILVWMWLTVTNRPGTPLRLIFAEPMRSLVTQAVSRIRKWIGRLGVSDEIGIVELLGEVPDLRERQRTWTRYPERPTIIVGTIDLLLSAALNRGYAMSRFAWPVAFGLLHNSAFWVIDEVQLIGAAAATVAQLAHFRQLYGTTGPVYTWWMSATLESNWLQTVDFTDPPAPTPVPEKFEQLTRDLGMKYACSKPLHTTKTLDAKAVRDAHRPGSLTLVVMNTVPAAQNLFADLQSPVPERRTKKAASVSVPPYVLLLHSRFRPKERGPKSEELIEADNTFRVDSDDHSSYPGGVIAVATQVVEAGLDISARTMLTQLAPWSSMVQRFGRLNRDGKETEAIAIWADVKLEAPYEKDEVDSARIIIRKLEDVSPATLAAIPLPEQSRVEYVISSARPSWAFLN